MFCTRTENNRINRVHERALRIIYDDYSSSFEALLERDGAVTFHVINIRKVAIEMFKVYHGIAPEVISDLFTIAESNVTRTGRHFVRNGDITVFHGEMSLSSFGPIVWNEMLPDLYKQCEDLSTFKRVIKNWMPKCNCRLCRVLIRDLGFVNIAN